MDGVDGAEDFTDDSYAANTVKKPFYPPNTDTNEYVFGDASAFFDGSNDYLYFFPSPNWDFGTNDFTIECWLKVRYSQEMSTIDCWHGLAGSFQLIWLNSRELRFNMYNGSLTYYVSAGTLNTSQWYSIAVTRESGTVRIFVDGVLKNSTTYSTQLGFASNRQLSIGRRTNTSSAWMDGWIDEIRITKNVARYTSNYSVQTAAFPNS
jgi:hypothetical protein